MHTTQLLARLFASSLARGTARFGFSLARGTARFDSLRLRSVWLALALSLFCGCGSSDSEPSDSSTGARDGDAGTRSMDAGADANTGDSGGARDGGGALDSGGARDGSADLDAPPAATGADSSTADGALPSGAGDARTEADSALPGNGVQVRWVMPAPNATLQGVQTFRLEGREFLNVEIKLAGATIATCAVAADHQSATAQIDTTQLPNGPITLTAHAWNSLARQPSTSDADAGPLMLVIANPGAAKVKKPFAVGSHWNEAPLYAAMREAGVEMIRIDANWDEVEGTQGTYNWAPLNEAMTAAQAAGIEVLLVIGYSAPWAASGDSHNHAPREEFDGKWAEFVQRTVTQFGGKVTAFEIWNEPDHDNFLKVGTGSWASNRYPAESGVNKKRLQYKHLLDLALAQPALADKVITTSGFAEGGSYDTGMRDWLEGQAGFLAQFDIASFHCYGYPSYQRLIDVPSSYRSTQTTIGKPQWPFWITEHGINMPGIANNTVKTYLIRTYAVALAQPGVEKLFWFRAGYDPGHMDFFDQGRRPTAAYDAFKTLTGHWKTLTSVSPWSMADARGSIATLANGKRVAIVWSDGAGLALNALGLSITAAFNQDGASIPTTSSLGGAPVFLQLSN